MASPTLGRLYPRGNSPVLILYEVEWTPGPIWTRRSEEKSPPLRHPGSNPARPARSQAPCRLSHVALTHLPVMHIIYLYIISVITIMRSQWIFLFFTLNTSVSWTKPEHEYFRRVKFPYGTSFPFINLWKN